MAAPPAMLLIGQSGNNVSLAISIAGLIVASLMMFGVLTLPLLIGGFVAVLLTGVKLEELRRRAEVSFARQTEVPSEP